MTHQKLNPKKLCTLFHYYACTEDVNRRSSLELLQYYPKEPVIFDVKSNSKISLTNLRTVSSSPVVPQVSSVRKIGKDANRSLVFSVKHSCTFVKTDQELPVVDITWNYNSYRYKTFESCLKNLYGDKYPPGDVVLNSMQLNLFDSQSNESVNLFDFLQDSQTSLTGADITGVSRKLEIEYLNPLDHFVNKLTDRPTTEERSTETLHEVADQRRSSDNACEDPIRTIITAQRIPKEKNTNRRSSRKIEPCKCNLSSHKRVYDDGKQPLEKWKSAVEEDCSWMKIR
nr:PREDICTED: uncharacterized protein LOC105662303 [Megachile rotundata]